MQLRTILLNGLLLSIAGAPSAIGFGLMLNAVEKNLGQQFITGFALFFMGFGLLLATLSMIAERQRQHAQQQRSKPRPTVRRPVILPIPDEDASY